METTEESKTETLEDVKRIIRRILREAVSADVDGVEYVLTLSLNFYLLAYDHNPNDPGYDPKEDIEQFIIDNKGYLVVSPNESTLIFASSVAINHWVTAYDNNKKFEGIKVAMYFIGKDLKSNGILRNTKEGIKNKTLYDTGIK